MSSQLSSDTQSDMSGSAKILVGKDPAEMSKHLCNAVERLFNSREDKEAAFVIGLSGGSLPNFFAMGAAAMNVDWAKVKFVFCDERLVPFDDADSTYGVYKKTDIFKLKGVDESSFVAIDPTLEVSDAAQSYAEKLTVFKKRFELIFLLLIDTLIVMQYIKAPTR